MAYMVYQMAATAVTLNDLEVIHRLQTFSDAIRRSFVQHSTRFQLRVCSHGSSALAELLGPVAVVVAPAASSAIYSECCVAPPPLILFSSYDAERDQASRNLDLELLIMNCLTCPGKYSD